MLAALFLSVLALADAACCKTALQYTVSSPGTLTYTFTSSYPSDTLSNGANASIAVVRGCNVDFVLDGTALNAGNHPFDINFAANGSNIPNFNQGQKSGTQSWMVPDDPASLTTYMFQCAVHSPMHNYIRVLDNCDMDGPPIDCGEYCMNISTACTGSNIQFPNPDVYGACMASCEYYPDNSTLAMSGDSYQCRAYQLSRAMANPGMYCDAAGFNGGAYSSTKCGTFCEAYCDAMMGGCTGNAAVFNSWADCMQECSYYPTNSSFDLSSSAIALNDTIDCRAWHVQVAINQTNNPNANMAHCGHASPQGGGYCGMACENFCDNDLMVCQGSLKQWNDRTQCLRACYSFPGQTNLTFANTPIPYINSLQCRKYHAFLAGQSDSNAQIHCIHTGALGGTVCGSGCEGLCNVAVKACPNQLNDTTCWDMCAALNSSDSVPTTNILSAMEPKGSVGCSTYWALKALGDSSMCSKLTDALMPSAGGKCDSSSALVLRVSWAVIAVIFLALGFTS